MRNHETGELLTANGDGTSLAELADVVAVQSLLASAALGENQRRARETILLVEDETFVRKATAEVLEAAGYEVILACDANQALDNKFHSFESIDLLLADVVMPGLSGLELAEKFSALNPTARVLMMSGYSEPLVFCAEGLQHRRVYLAKPFSIPTLLRRVREVLDKPIRNIGDV